MDWLNLPKDWQTWAYMVVVCGAIPWTITLHEILKQLKMINRNLYSMQGGKIDPRFDD